MASESAKGMTRREFITRGAGIVAGVSLLTGFGKEVPGAPKAVRKPNILYIFPDQMRAAAMGCMGDPNVKTPNLDRLAKQGVLFTNSISCYPVCSPYRASLLTGRYPTANGVIANGIELPDSETTIAEVLKAQGYKTGYIGKWHLEKSHAPFVPRNRRQGFDYWASRNAGGPHFDSECFMDDPDKPVPMKGWVPDVQTDLAIAFMKKNVNNPFCLFLSWGPPHPEYGAPEKYEKMYDPKNLRLRPNVRGNDIRETMVKYYGMITSLDANIARLMAALDQLGISDDTIVCFSSDHGDMMGSQGLIGKNVPWEESINVPFIMRYPRRLKAGQKNDMLFSSVDVMPTLLSLCGAPIPRAVQGKDLSAAVLGKGGVRRDAVLLERVFAPLDRKTGIAEWRGIRTTQHTFVRGREKDWVLYDNKKDPYQLNNLAGKPGSKALRDQLDAKLQAMLKEAGDDFAPSETWRQRVRQHASPRLLRERPAANRSRRLQEPTDEE